MIKILHFNKDLNAPQEYAAAHLPDLLQHPDGVTWVDLSGNSDDTYEALLMDVFHFHPLAIQDALHESHAAKLDQWEDYVYLVVHGRMRDNHIEPGEDLPELDIFLGHQFIVTHHHNPMDVVKVVWDMCLRDR